ncbi:MAG: non-ribosomal peptide synthetase [Hyphomicrobiales bacterium]|nr:non-ribosomal peptide synthetase [Hyphomicrobiales bacterium]
MEQNLWRAFETAAMRAPEKLALHFPAERVTFSDLHLLARRAHAFLAAKGLKCGDVLTLQTPKCVEVYALMLGALRMGAIYAHIDPKNPEPRTAKMLSRLEPQLLVSVCDGAANAFGHVERMQPGAMFRDAWPDAASDAPADVTHSHPAYVMFTSGSTGEPKGAVMPQYGVLSLMRWADELLGGAAARTFSAVNPTHFDNSVFDFYCGLVNGATLAPVDVGHETNPRQWVETLRASRASMIFAVPTFFLLLDDMGLLTPENLPDARVFMFGGEGFPLERLRRFEAAFRGRARFVNVYGPTETSCICSSIEITPAELADCKGPFASIGRMHRDFSHAVLDEDLREVPLGEKGELWIGGPCVGLGYMRNPDETARRFVQDPRQNAYRSVMYRTGDLVSQDTDGRLWFAGRADNQVKVSGHRIELEEIDRTAQGAPGVRRAVTALVRSPYGDRLCLAFAGDGELDEAGMTRFCRDALPPYMQPQTIMRLDDIPLNANGKADRLAVRALFEQGGAAQPGAPDAATVAAPTPPQSAIEWERALAAIFTRVLSTPHLPPEDNFFDRGGTSMLLRQAHAAIQRELYAEVQVIDLFSRPNLRSLAAHLHAAASSASEKRHGAGPSSHASRQAEALRALAAARQNGRAGS